ncbi:MAG: cyclic nucleotide-binding domain-containing protein [Ectothiorhodospiraceae bacterium]|nr:cyclic nucleotide-binding domain-containing protein [Chromatiales bacterium]MCP5156803.1 cyclic nucleotide-binding domain-containing protein [Ectothiorhodospiraceae bacterium]
MDLQTEVELLRKVPMFAKLEPAKLKLLAFTSQALTFEDGEMIFRAGEHADSAYVIMDGEIEILSPTDAGPVVSGLLGRNELFGELAVLTNSPRSAALRARGAVRALRISDDMFLKLLAENSEVALDVMRQLSVKLTRTHHQYEELRRELERRTSASSPLD